MRYSVHLARMDEKRNAYRILVGKPGRKGTLQRCRWKDNFKMGLVDELCWHGFN
jgi:hypothetical protein